MQEYFKDKREARAYFSSLRASIPELERRKKSESICKKISSLYDFCSCDILFAYYPIKSEASALHLAELALSLGKRLAMPISLTDSHTLDFRIISSLDDMQIGAYGIPEPPRTAQKAIFTEKSLCIVPALAIDTQGRRLGYGKGFYDRFLKNFSGISIGITYQELLCSSIPADEYDIPLNKIVTDAKIIAIP